MIENNKIKRFNEICVEEILKKLKDNNNVFSIIPRKSTEIIASNIFNEEIVKSGKYIEAPVKKEYVEKRYIPSLGGEINFYTTSTIEFTDCHEEYVNLREKYMRLDLEQIEKIEGVVSPTIKEINFDRTVIGSDETGTGEVFRPIVVVACYLKSEDTEDGLKDFRDCLRLGIYDSKGIKGKIPFIGKALTHIESWEDELIQKAIYKKEEKDGVVVIKESEVIVNDFTAIKIITNEELNDKCKERYKDVPEVLINGVKEELIEKAHEEVLNALAKRHKTEDITVVIDDFIENKKDSSFKKDIRNNFREVYFTTKGDAKILAVGLASDISFYITKLGVDYAKRKLAEVCKDGKTMNINIDDKKKINKDLFERIKPEKLKEISEKYAKIYFVKQGSSDRIADIVNGILMENGLETIR